MENQGWEFQVQGPARAKVLEWCGCRGVGVGAELGQQRGGLGYAQELGSYSQST